MRKEDEETLLKIYNYIENFDTIEQIIFVTKLNEFQIQISNIISRLLKINYDLSLKQIIIGEVNQDLGVSFGTNRIKDSLIIADWVFDLQIKTRTYIIFFYLVKECLINFYNDELNEAKEAIINICSILFITELLDIISIDNPVLSAIRSKFYSEEIANLSYLYWDNLLLLLIKKRVSFSAVFAILHDLSNKKTRQDEQAKYFLDWVIANTIKDENTILPIYVNSKLIELIKTMLDIGYERSSTSYIARKLNTSQKTITKRFKALNEGYYTYWRPDFSYEKINLYNYLLRIEYKNKNIRDILIKYLMSIPYLKSLFEGHNKHSKILYSPTLVCPHIIADNLYATLKKQQKDQIITDFCLQSIRYRKRFITITNYPYDPAINTFKDLLAKNDTSLEKLIFTNQRLEPTKPNLDDNISIDYNLLYFLTILKSKYLLKARYGVDINRFRDFHIKNDIPITDIEAQTNLLYQNELRAKNKGILSYSLYMRSMIKPRPNILVFEILKDPTLDKAQFQKIIKKIRIFSLLTYLELYDRHLLLLPGISLEHPIKKLLEENLKCDFQDINFYTIKKLDSKYVPLQDLYDYETNKWKFLDYIKTHTLKI